MPRTTIVEIPPEEQARMVAELRRVRYGYFLALHVVLLRAAGRPPSDIAAVLFCSRSSVYRAVHAYHAGHWADLRGGEEVEAKFTGVDRKGRSISLSIKAKDIHEEQEAMQNYRTDASSGTSLGDLLKEHISGQD